MYVSSQLSSEAISLYIGPSYYPYLFFVCASSESADKNAHLHILVRAFAACVYNEYQNFIFWRICLPIVLLGKH